MWLPSADSVQEIHFSLAKIFEQENDPISPVGIKSMQMLESACERPNTGMGNTFKYTNLEEKLAALFHSLTKNHPFHNGNKRTALVSLLTSLYRNDRRLNSDVKDDDLFYFVMAVTANEFPNIEHGHNVDYVVKEISRWIRRNTVSLKAKPTGMRVNEFIKKCIEAGGHCKNSSGGSYVISNKEKSIRISKSTKKIDGAVVRQYLNALGFSEASSGITIEEFQEGADGEREQIYRYMSTLRRLAKT
jgi:death-on-curing family protein